MRSSKNPLLVALLVLSCLGVGIVTAQPATRPATKPAGIPTEGDAARDFTLKTLGDRAVKLSTLTAEGPVVLIVLRGWPGYQCPICTRQVADLLARAKDFEAAGATVLMVYPGPSKDLKGHAEEFIEGHDFPGSFRFVIDPDYSFVNAYGLRWDAAGETAYPSTFVIDRENRVRFADVSKTHGGRVSAADALKAVKALNE